MEFRPWCLADALEQHVLDRRATRAHVAVPRRLTLRFCFHGRTQESAGESSERVTTVGEFEGGGLRRVMKLFGTYRFKVLYRQYCTLL